jgi:cellulose synthase/poly-beta-1,6-N-acetylglucosamine synthase-like glycosyltransferase
MDSKLLKDGWNATGLTEDMETVIDLASKDKKIGYASEAEFYDEQPTNFRIHVRQRIRWSRGFINVWAKDSWKLIGSFFRKPTWSKYDLFWDIFPYSLVTFILQWVNTFAGLGVLIATHNVDVSILISTFVVPFVFSYIIGIIQGIVIVIKEWKKIHLTFWQAVGYLLLWPINDIIGMPIALISLFMKVTWKPIPHHVVKDANVMVEEEEAKGRKHKEKKHV